MVYQISQITSISQVHICKYMSVSIHLSFFIYSLSPPPALPSSLSPDSPVCELVLFVCLHLTVVFEQERQRVAAEGEDLTRLMSVKHVHHVHGEVTL